MLGFDGEYPAVQPKAKVKVSRKLKFPNKKLQKISCKTFHRKPILLNFVNLSPKFCPKLQAVFL